MAVVVAVLVVLTAVAVYLDWARSRYPLEAGPLPPLMAGTRDGWKVAVWPRRPERRRFADAVILCHGLANNHRYFEFMPPRNLALALSEAGFVCYSVDLRGAGASEPPHEGPYAVSFDDCLHLDVPAVVDAVKAHCGAERVWWVGHSLGGLLGLAALTRPVGGELRGLVTIGSPVFQAQTPFVTWLLDRSPALAPWGQLELGFLRYLAPLVGAWKPRGLASANLDNLSAASQRLLLANVFAPIWRGVLDQLADWVRHDAFRSVDGSVDYRDALNTSLPVLVVGGSKDMLAPPAGTVRYFEALATPDKALALFGAAYGQAMDYGHGDLITGDRAHLEVYPTIVDFLVRRAAPVAGSDGEPVAQGTPDRRA